MQLIKGVGFVSFACISLSCLLCLNGCRFDDSDSSGSSTTSDSAEEAVNFSLESLSYTIATSEEDSDTKVATVNYTINVDADEAKDVTVDFYLLPVDSDSTDTTTVTATSVISDSSDSDELDEDSYELLYRETLTALPVGSNALTIEIELPDDVETGNYQIIPVVDPLDEYNDTDREDNVPAAVASTEPSDENSVSDSYTTSNESLSNIAVESDETDTSTGAITETETANTALLLSFSDDSDDSESENTVSGDFTLKSDSGLTGSYVLTATVSIWDEDVPVNLWDSSVQDYSAAQVVTLSDVTETQIGYTIYLDDDISSQLIEQTQEMSTDDQPYQTQFTMTLTPESQYCDEIGESDGCVSGNDTSSTSSIVYDTTFGLPTYVLTEDDSSDSTTIADSSHEASYATFAWDKPLGNKKKLYLDPYLTFGVSFISAEDIVNLLNDDEVNFLTGSLEVGSKIVMFKAENQLIDVTGQVGLVKKSGEDISEKKVGYSAGVEISTLGNTIYTKSNDEDVEAEADEDEDEKYAKEWETTKVLLDKTFVVGGVPLKTELGITGSLGFNLEAGFDGTLYIGNMGEDGLVTSSVDMYAKGGVSIGAITSGPIIDLTLLDTAIRGKVYGAAWDEKYNWDLYTGAQSNMDLDVISGQFGVYAEATTVKWCKKKKWHIKVRYPCGTKDQTYSLWLYKTNGLIDWEGHTLLDKTWGKSDD